MQSCLRWNCCYCNEANSSDVETAMETSVECSSCGALCSLEIEIAVSDVYLVEEPEKEE